jgi:hypothetical protein
MGGEFKMVVIALIFKSIWDLTLVIDTSCNEGLMILDHHIYGGVGAVVFNIGKACFNTVDKAMFFYLGKKVEKVPL